MLGFNITVSGDSGSVTRSSLAQCKIPSAWATPDPSVVTVISNGGYPTQFRAVFSDIKEDLTTVFESERLPFEDSEVVTVTLWDQS